MVHCQIGLRIYIQQLTIIYGELSAFRPFQLLPSPFLARVMLT